MVASTVERMHRAVKRRGESMVMILGEEPQQPACPLP
jgi:hypothetical protein